MRELARRRWRRGQWHVLIAAGVLLVRILVVLVLPANAAHADFRQRPAVPRAALFALFHRRKLQPETRRGREARRSQRR